MSDPTPPVAGAGARPVRTTADVLAAFPSWIAEPDAAPIRDALVEALTQMICAWEFRSEIALAQIDVLRATRTYLEQLGEDEGTPRDDETLDEESYRDEVLVDGDATTEKAIIDGVNLILATVTDKQCRMIDALLDGWFVKKEPHALLSKGTLVASGTWSTELTVPIAHVASRAMRVLHTLQAAGTVKTPKGWSLIASQILPGGRRHTAWTRLAADDDPSVTLEYADTGGGAVMARAFAFRGAFDGDVQAYTGNSQFITAPALYNRAKMLALMAYGLSSAFALELGGWTTLTADVTAYDSLHSATVLSTTSPSNTAANLGSASPWSMIAVPVYDIGGRDTWGAFLGRSPNYPTRLYDADAAKHGGKYRPNSTPLGVQVFPTRRDGRALGRKFMLLLPNLLPRDSSLSVAYSAGSGLVAGTYDGRSRIYVSHAGSATGRWFATGSSAAATVYRAIETFVDRVIGQSVRWVADGIL